MVPIMTAARVELIMVSPWLSPIKYRQGSNKARSMIHLMSFRSILCNRLMKSDPVSRIALDIINLKKTIENGGNTSLAILNQINVRLQKIIARETLIYVFVDSEMFISGMSGYAWEADHLAWSNYLAKIIKFR
jgi:hypothetical protein